MLFSALWLVLSCPFQGAVGVLPTLTQGVATGLN
jgi:hypothetical protein